MSRLTFIMLVIKPFALSSAICGFIWFGSWSEYIFRRLFTLVSISSSTLKAAYVLFAYRYSLTSSDSCPKGWIPAAGGADVFCGEFIVTCGSWDQIHKLWRLLAGPPEKLNRIVALGNILVLYLTEVPMTALLIETGASKRFRLVTIRRTQKTQIDHKIW